MCIAKAGKVVRIEDNTAVVDYGGVSRREELTLVPDVCAGDTVLVHAGFIIGKLDSQEGEELLSLLEEIKSFRE